ncbi:MAG: putative oxidoreductase, partial [Rickettsiales bacterium]
VKIDSFDTTIMLFTYEYAIPFFSPTLMAYFATFFELTCGILIFFGFLARLSALPLIVMTIVIQTLVLQHNEHYYWLFLLSTLTIYGSGNISVDYLLTKLLNKNDKK